MREMEFNKHDPKWIKLRIRNRFVPWERKYFGLYVDLVPITGIQEVMSKLHYSSKKLVVDTLNMVASRSMAYEKFPVLNTLLN